MRRSSLALIPVSLGFAAAAPPAQAADLSNPVEKASGAKLAIAPDGTTAVGWSVEGGPNQAFGRVATRTPASAAFTTQVLAPFPGGSRSDVRALAVGRGGDAAVTTLSTNAFSPRLQVAVRRPGQAAFGAFANVSPDGEGAGDGDVVVTPDGTVVVVWQQRSGSTTTVRSAQLRRGDAAFSAPAPISAASAITNADLAVDAAVNARGDVVAAWALPVGGGNKALQVAERPAGGGAFAAARTVSTGPGSAIDPSVAVDERGVPTVAWAQLGHYPGQATSALQVSSRPVGAAAFQAPQTLTESGTSGDDPVLATDLAGRTTVVYTKAFPIPIMGPPAPQRPQEVHAATRPLGGVFDAPVRLSDGVGDATEPVVVAAPGGTVAAAWTDHYEEVQVARRSAGAPAFATQVVDTGGRARFPQLALGPDGDATFVWMGYDADGGIVRVGDLDTTAPVIGAVSVPPTAAAGQTVRMSVTARDRLSAVTAAWSFGDRTTALGTAVAHAYAAPGTYPVTVTVTDAVGNSARATRVVTVPAQAPAAAKLRLSKVSLSRKRVRPAKKGRAYAKKAKKRRGTTLRLTASAAGTLRLTLARRVKGHRRKGKCSLKAKRGKSCRRYRKAGRLPSVKAVKGKQRFVLTGRRKGRRLKSGRYRMTLVLTRAGRRSRPVRRTFRVVRGQVRSQKRSGG